MTNPEVRVFDDLHQLSRALAERFCRAAQEAVAARGLFTAALSGGSSPRPFFELLAGPEFAGQVPWDSANLFQVDERTVPPDHPDSNYKMIRETLLDHVPAARAHFHRMEAESKDLESAAAAYAGEIARVLQVKPGSWPRFDFIHLGMGPDGHTASLFPGSAGLQEQERWVIPNYVEKFRTWRLTLTYPVINAGREVVFLAAGADKAEPLRCVLHPGSSDERLPSQGIQPAAGELRFYLDRAAARLL